MVLGLVGSAEAELPPDWENQDVGNVGAAGSADFDSSTGIFTITGNGGDIWDAADRFHYVFTQITGDCEIVARVVDNGTGSNAWAKGGVMIRQDNTGPSAYVYMAVTGGNGGGACFQWRDTPGAGANWPGDHTSGVTPPRWVKLVRVGNSFTGYLSTDGVTWEASPTEPHTVNMTGTVLIGLAVTSHADGELRTFTFDNISPQFLTPPGSPTNPSPAIEATDVPREVVLSWTPGEFAAPTNGHKVYFGESFNDVNDATGGVAQSAASYAPAQRLDFGTTYYWRVDEVNAPPEATVFEGDVWSFTTEPVAYAIENISATTSSTHQADTGPENSINGSGLDVNDLHSTEATDMWLSGDEPNGAWIEYELDKVHKLHEMWVWNANQMIESLIGFGLKDVTIEYSTNGTDYTTLGTTHEFARAPGTSDYAHNTTVDFSGTPAKYVRLTANSNWGGIMPQYGLSEVRFFHIPVHAREPYPDSEATDVDVDVVIGFRAGREAVTHDVYLSTDEQAVIDGNAPVSTVTETSYGPLSLDLGEAYYWKINEVNDAETTTTWQGDIWNFTTQEYLVVDDFEDYNDYPPDEIWYTWLDGYGVPANGATVGYPAPDWNLDEHYVETAIVHGGEQSMPFFYDNTGTATYSEGERTFAVPQDWTKAGVQTLTLWFNGTSGNTGQLYVKVNGSKVGYEGEAGNLARAGWQPWNIELASFGTNLQSVTTLAIGIDGSGASGTLYFDDIRLYSYSPQFITPAEPNNAGLVMHLGFDDGFGTIAGDSSGRGNGGILEGDPQWVAGQIGGALEFDGDGDYVNCGNPPDLTITDEITVACWIKVAAFTKSWETIIAKGDDSYRMGRGPELGDSIHFGCNGPTGGNLNATTIVTDDTWHHVALVYDGSDKIIYIDGFEDARVASTGQINVSTYDLYIGENSQATSRYLAGLVDDVRIYDYPLSGAEVGWLAGITEPFDKPF